jgi:hypothetical protein
VASRNLRSADGAISFNVIMTTAGEARRLPLLGRMLWTFGPQLTKRDFITLISDANMSAPGGADVVAAVNASFMTAHCNNCTKIFIQNAAPLGGYGHASRSAHQRALPGDFHLHADDDDMYTPDAFEIIRAVVTTLEPRVYVFRCAKENIYKDKGRRELIFFPALHTTNASDVGLYNGGTPNGVVRNVPAALPDWRPTIGGDAVWLRDAIAAIGGPARAVLVPRVTYMIKDDLYARLHELGIDQPKGFFFTDSTGRPLPDGPVNRSAPWCGGREVRDPNPLDALRNRFEGTDGPRHFS